MRVRRSRLRRRGRIVVVVVRHVFHGIHLDLPRIVFRAHAQQGAEEGDSGPNLLVAVIGPGRHAGHLDAVSPGGTPGLVKSSGRRPVRALQRREKSGGF
jgi:hypothetical protein